MIKLLLTTSDHSYSRVHIQVHFHRVVKATDGVGHSMRRGRLGRSRLSEQDHKMIQVSDILTVDEGTDDDKGSSPQPQS